MLKIKKMELNDLIHDYAELYIEFNVNKVEDAFKYLCEMIREIERRLENIPRSIVLFGDAGGCVYFKLNVEGEFRDYRYIYSEDALEYEVL